MNDEAALQGRPATHTMILNDSTGSGVHNESAQLRALIAAAWPHRGTPELREHAERIVEWHALRPIARGDVAAVRTLARNVLEAELHRQQRVSVDALVELLRRTEPHCVMALRNCPSSEAA